MSFLPRPVVLVCVAVALFGGVGLPAGAAQAAAPRATRVSGWTGPALVATPGQVVRLSVAVRPAKKSAKRVVVLQRRAAGAGSWSNIATSRTDRRGVAVLRVPTTRSFDGSLRLWVTATRRARAAATPARRFVVRPRSSAAVAAPVPATTSTEREVIRLVNLARSTARTCGSQRFTATAPLRTNDRLSEASRGHALDMGQQGYFSHTSLDGRSPWDRARAAGYDDASGENIAAGYETPADVVQGWLGSPGHCANIMAPDAVDTGVGFADVPGSPYETYWVQLFGRG